MAKKTNYSSNGKEYFRVRAKIGVDAAGKNIYKTFYGSSKSDAESKRDSYMFSIENGLSVDFDKTTFSGLFEQWFEIVKKPSVTMNTYARYEATYRLYVKPSLFYKMKLIDIKGLHIQKTINALPTPGIAERVNLLLVSFFKYCIDERYLSNSPMTGIKLPKQIEIERKEFLEREEIAKLSLLGQEDFLYVFAAFTGMRQGEILALTHGDIDFDKEIINITKSVKRVTFVDGKKRDSRTLVKEPKTSSSKRQVPLMKNLIDPLKKQIAIEKSKHLALGVKYYKNTALLFSSKVLTHKRADHVLTDWKSVQKDLFEEPVTFHALRHTFCTMLCDKGVPLTVAAQLMGHSTVEQVTRIYAHFMKESPKEAIDSLSSFYSAAK